MTESRESHPVQVASVPPRRIQFLDVLRGIAIFLVLWRHTLGIEQVVVGYQWWIILKLKLVGWAGVDLFFVLSGFLVGGLLCAEYRKRGSVRSGRFLLRRAFKIYPSFYALLVSTLLWKLYQSEPLYLRSWLGEGLFLQNYLGRVWPQTWSLAVEEHFYLLIALLFWVGSKTRSLDRPVIVLGFGSLLLLGVLVLRVWLNSNAAFDQESQMFATHMRIDSLLFGSLLAYVWHMYPERTQQYTRSYRWILLIFAVACLAPLAFVPFEHPSMRTYGFTRNYLGFGTTLLLGVCGSWECPWRWLQLVGRLIASVGRQSYSIYLWHMAVFYALDELLPRTIPFGQRYGIHATLFFVLSVVFGSLIAIMVESPALRLRDRLLPSPTA